MTIRIEAFHVIKVQLMWWGFYFFRLLIWFYILVNFHDEFQLFIANQNKPREIVFILAKNKEKLLRHIEEIKMEKGKFSLVPTMLSPDSFMKNSLTNLLSRLTYFAIG